MKALSVKRIAELWFGCARLLAIGLMLWLNLQVGAMLPVPGVRAGEKNVAPASGRHSWSARSSKAGWKPASAASGRGPGVWTFLGVERRPEGRLSSAVYIADRRPEVVQGILHFVSRDGPQAVSPLPNVESPYAGWKPALQIFGV